MDYNQRNYLTFYDHVTGGLENLKLNTEYTTAQLKIFLKNEAVPYIGIEASVHVCRSSQAVVLMSKTCSAVS